jgi:hypothetical protein
MSFDRLVRSAAAAGAGGAAGGTTGPTGGFKAMLRFVVAVLRV